MWVDWRVILYSVFSEKYKKYVIYLREKLLNGKIWSRKKGFYSLLLIVYRFFNINILC